MNSNRPSQVPRGEAPMSSLFSASPLQRPAAGSHLSPRRREHVVQPPALTTSLSGLQYQGLGLSYSPAPNSTTSLSSPFSQSSNSTYLPSPGGVARGSSPMASRLSGVYNAPYNPREWGPVGGNSPALGSSQISGSRQSSTPSIAPAPPRPRASDEPLVGSPPPPYSPQRTNPEPRSGSSTTTTISPADTAASPANIASPYCTPLTTATSISPDLASSQRYSSSRPLSLVMSGDSPNAPWNTGHSFPPPPPATGRGSRSSSKTGDKSHSLFSLSSFTGRSKQASTASPTPNAIDALQQSTSQALSRGPEVRIEAPIRPPASRRSASASAVASASSSSRDQSRSGSRSPSKNWEPGMPLPGPPPGPPPAARSQSLSGSSESSSSRRLLNPVPQTKLRQPPVLGTSLDPVPPTPADWVDDDQSITTTRPLRTPVGTLHIDTLNLVRSRSPRLDSDISENLYSETTEPFSSMTGESYGVGLTTSTNTSVSGGLFRSSAVRRDSSAKGIRERRSESRTGKERATAENSAVSVNSNPWADAMESVKPGNLVLPVSEPGIVRRRTVTKSTPRSSRNSRSPPNSARSKQSSGVYSAHESSKSTPKLEAFRQLDLSTQTPPFSPGGDSCSSAMFNRNSSPPIPPKALPTPPPSKIGESSYLSAKPGSLERPVSHLLHIRDDDSMMPGPLTPSRSSSQLSGTIGANSQTDGETSFVREALQRYRMMLEREESATSEGEKLKIFVDFMASESRIRRIQYANVFTDRSFDLPRAQSRLFQHRSMSPPKSPSLPGRMHSIEPPSPLSSVDLQQNRPDSAWWNNYKPSLSPIASLSMSNDEMSSRGRAPSRWWESSHTGSEGGERKVRRSKRESKYMGLPREVREQMQMEHSQRSANPSELPNSPPPAQAPAYAENEYPPEKVGWHEPSPSLPPPPPLHSPPVEVSKLDVSRLVTLPPPYPRHHPAVNNSHPDLISYRTLVRSVTDLDEVNASKERHSARVEALQLETQQKIKNNRREFKANIQNQIEAGSVSYAEAAEAEAALRLEELSIEKDRAQTEFDIFQEDIIKPVHETLTSRIHKTTFYIDELRSKIFKDAQRSSPNQTQEEGDEQPESLEKLTQLKWLFEARESLHREVYDLLTARNEKYKAIVILPYRQSGNDEKIRSTESFFTSDALDRRVQFETETLARYESFQAVIEENVVRGVEEQLSAFWDIAPSLLAVLQKIPDNLSHFSMHIPADEYTENPSYHAYPLQYLYSLLSHAEKSTYQFIESQINLLCLLHEVKTAVMSAGCAVMAVQLIKEGQREERVKADMEEKKRTEGNSLTGDLQDKVRMVEGQWGDALGTALGGVKDRVRERLCEQGGWEGEAEE